MKNEIKVRHTEHFNELTCEQEHYITNYNEHDDISTFNASKLIVCPLSVDLSKYRCISEEEYNKLNSAKLNMIESSKLIFGQDLN